MLMRHYSCLPGGRRRRSFAIPKDIDRPSFWLRTSICFFPSNWFALVTYPAVITLSIGFATRFSASAYVLCLIVSLLLTGAAPTLHVVSHVLDAVALALIGPGTFSIDALIFGRRTLRLPG